MRSTRRWTLVLSVLALLVVPTGTAIACEEPSISYSPRDPGPGDTVNYSIARLDNEASFTLHIEGELVATGTEATGSFVMPDLGETSYQVTPNLGVIHDGQNIEASSQPLYYTVQAPVQEDQPGSGADEGSAAAGDKGEEAEAHQGGTSEPKIREESVGPSSGGSPVRSSGVSEADTARTEARANRERSSQGAERSASDALSTRYMAESDLRVDARDVAAQIEPPMVADRPAAVDPRVVAGVLVLAGMLLSWRRIKRSSPPAEPIELPIARDEQDRSAA